MFSTGFHKIIKIKHVALFYFERGGGGGHTHPKTLDKSKNALNFN